MKVADLYVWVSTDEQADKGYSQRNQEEVLLKYCDVNKFSVRKVIYEDHSAKTFHRPAWLKLLAELKQFKHRTDLILFTKWDRFSRNAGDAYQMISMLRKLGAEPQAIEQPLDLSIPENKMMLAFYLAAPEVENDRRALNVFHGMRRARKEGRYMGKAPVGYHNKITESGKKYIAPYEPAATIMKWAFEELAGGRFAVEQIWKEAVAKGLECKRNSFWYAIRNPAYCGKVLVSGYKDEETCYAPGLHEPIISEAVFYQVQDFLDGKKTKYRTKLGSQEIFQLRGFMVCPKCGKVLTASASKGRNGKYHYYHCNAACGTRFKSENANELFARELRKYVPRSGMTKVYSLVINDAYTARTKGKREDIRTIKSELEKINLRLSNARNLLLNNTLDSGEYKDIKSDCEIKMQVLESKLLEASSKSVSSIEMLINKSIQTLAGLENLYVQSDTEKRRQIIGSIYPEKLVFDGFRFRTARLNSAVELIYKLGEGFSEKEKGKIAVKNNFSYLVDPYGFEP